MLLSRQPHLWSAAAQCYLSFCMAPKVHAQRHAHVGHLSISKEPKVWAGSGCASITRSERVQALLSERQGNPENEPVPD